MVKSAKSLKVFVRGTYAVQKLRIQMGNGIVANFKVKLGQAPSESEDELDEKGQEILKGLRDHYKKITDGIKIFPRQADFKGDEVISDYTELCLIAEYVDLEKHEDHHFRRLGNILNEYPIYTKYLEKVAGIGPAIAGIIISEIDISKANSVSALWKYCGLDVAQDGAGRSRRAEHLVDKAYTDREGKEQTRKSITFNPFIKTKLLGVMGSSFLRVKDSPWAEVYRNYKHRLEHHAVYGIANDGTKDPRGMEIRKGRRHNMAIRYMVKMFLISLYTEWRKIEGLPVRPPYSEDKLGMAPHSG